MRALLASISRAAGTKTSSVVARSSIPASASPVRKTSPATATHCGDFRTALAFQRDREVRGCRHDAARGRVLPYCVGIRVHAVDEAFPKRLPAARCVGPPRQLHGNCGRCKPRQERQVCGLRRFCRRRAVVQDAKPPNVRFAGRQPQRPAGLAVLDRRAPVRRTWCHAGARDATPLRILEQHAGAGCIGQVRGECLGTPARGNDCCEPLCEVHDAFGAHRQPPSNPGRNCPAT